jgi:hypothetical protein
MDQKHKEQIGEQKGACSVVEGGNGNHHNDNDDDCVSENIEGYNHDKDNDNDDDCVSENIEGYNHDKDNSGEGDDSQLPKHREQELKQERQSVSLNYQNTKKNGARFEILYSDDDDDDKTCSTSPSNKRNGVDDYNHPSKRHKHA